MTCESHSVNVRQLEAFHALMTMGSVTRAAEKLRVSQPAVTKLIQAFESDIGLTLFDRASHRLVPTAEAVRLHGEIDQLFLHIGRIRHIANEIASLGTGQLRVGALPALGLQFIPDVLSEFVSLHAGIDVVLSIGTSQKVVEMSLAHQIDIGIVASSVSALAPSSAVIARLPGMAILPKGHALTRRSILKPKDFQDCSFISLGREDNTRRLVDALFASHDVKRTTLIETHTAACACQFVSNGSGLSIVDPITADYYRGKVALRRVEPTIYFEMSVVRSAARMESRLVQKFLKFFEKKIQRFLDPEKLVSAHD